MPLSYLVGAPNRLSTKALRRQHPDHRLRPPRSRRFERCSHEHLPDRSAPGRPLPGAFPPLFYPAPHPLPAPLPLVGHSMGAMVVLAYLSRRACERAVDPHGLVLVATAAGKLAQRGLGRLLGTPATPLLFKVMERAPDPALKMLAAPVCAALSRWCSCGPAQRATLAATAAEALATTPVSTAVGFLPTLRDYDVYPTLGSVRAQTVVVSGG